MLVVGFAACLCALIKDTAYQAESVVRLGDAEDDPINISFSCIGVVHDALGFC